MIYRVKLADGTYHNVPAIKWPDPYPRMSDGDTYDEGNTAWWDDIVAGLREHVPGTEEIVAVEAVSPHARFLDHFTE